MSDATTDVKPDLAADLRAVVRDAEILLRQAANNAGQEYEAARDRLEETLRNARFRLQDAEDAVVDRAKAAGRAADDYVHANPWQSVGLGAAVGLALGLLIGRR
ncbi:MULTISPECIES: DUF883 family protein [Ramlibacter]|uniref:DUF883 family protein n=1 Tax=Ramlibacter aquaticus TaxID=2780094 RepID=A0ABR9SE62_9BURK|nr:MULTISPECIES: DUF883 family protein [Ramlibacter]MBE7940644.1 DUF883 family protein [Ramlibacter aquaticus]